MIDKKKVNEISKMLLNLKEQCKGIKMKTKTIESLFEGAEIRECPYCHTLNLVYLVGSDKEKFDMYFCNKCNNTYMERWDKF